VHLNQQRTGGSNELQQKVWEIVQPVLEEWTGQHLSPVSLYGIRLYHNNSILAPHVSRIRTFVLMLFVGDAFIPITAFPLLHQVDRFPLITSAISKFESSQRHLAHSASIYAIFLTIVDISIVTPCCSSQFKWTKTWTFLGRWKCMDTMARPQMLPWNQVRCKVVPMC
jgi:hypothetical protein